MTSIEGLRRLCRRGTGGRRRGRGGRVWPAAAVSLLAAWASLLSGSHVSAMPPLDNPPSADGMPGAAFLGQLIGWGKWVGLLACAMAFIYGAATWRGWGSQSSARAADGKGWVISGSIGAALIGLVGFVIPMVYRAAGS